jgi:hypothetical protein
VQLVPRLGCVRQVAQRVPLGGLLDVAAADALAVVRARDLGLVALAVVFQAARALAVAPLVVAAFVADVSLADLRPERVRVALQTRLDRRLAVLLVLQVVEAVVAVAHVAELAVGEAVAISAHGQKDKRV